MKHEPKRSRTTLVAICVVVGLAAMIGLSMLNRPVQQPSTNAGTPTDDADSRNARKIIRAQSTGRDSNTVIGEQANVRPNDAPATTAAEEAPPEPPEREENARIGYVIDDFRNFDKPLEGYKLENLERTVDGIALAKADPSTTSPDGTFRRGTIESPVLPLGHPSNAVQPIWRAEIPEEAGAIIEVALSADQQNWSEWYPIQPSGDEISPTYPDGRPNPNYGAISGGSIANGLDLYPYARYRVTLTSNTDASPVLQEFKLTYLDSTDGQGKIPDPNAPKPTPAPTPAI